MSFKKHALWFVVIMVVVGVGIWLYKKFIQGTTENTPPQASE